MTRVHILDLPPSHYALPVPSDWYPLYINRQYFKDAGITFRFFTKPEPALNDCDYIFLSSRFFVLQTKSDDQRQAQFSFINSLRHSTTRVYWFDFRDSTGNTQFEVLPYVDLYLKKQLLRDFSLYTSQLYGNRVYTDYLHRVRGVNDDYTEPFTPLLPQFHTKLKISWNPGLLDFRGGLRRRLIMQLLTDRLEAATHLSHHITWQDPTSYRPYNMLARFNTAYQRQTVSWQRRQALYILAPLLDSKIVSRSNLTLAEELTSRRRAKIVLSLFGWGEICSRDFQAWIAGAALLAPDTSHLLTYPVTHIPHQTYWPIKWDLSDLLDAYRRLLDDPDLRLRLAANGQARYRSVWSVAGRQRFVHHITSLLHASPTDRPSSTLF